MKQISISIVVVVAVALIAGVVYMSPKGTSNNEVTSNSVSGVVSDKMVSKEVEGAMPKPEVATKSDVMMKPDKMIQVGSYETYAPEKIAKASSGEVVLFFRASWCPSCRAVDADIKAHLKDIPEKLTILDVDYDTSAVLKQKYGVTYQHTFVQIDGSGNLIKKWSGSPTLATLVAEAVVKMK